MIARAKQSMGLMVKMEDWHKTDIQPTLYFTPYAWLKLLAMRNAGKTEVGGFGICPSQFGLVVTDFALVKQTASMGGIDFDDTDLAVHLGSFCEAGLQPDQVQRVWIHTHPGNSSNPSGVDTEHFDEHFNGMDWHVMFILAMDNTCQAHLRCRTIPQNHQATKQQLLAATMRIDVMIFDPTIHGNSNTYPTTELNFDKLKTVELRALPLEAWMEEYEACVIPTHRRLTKSEWKDRKDDAAVVYTSNGNRKATRISDARNILEETKREIREAMRSTGAAATTGVPAWMFPNTVEDWREVKVRYGTTEEVVRSLRTMQEEDDGHLWYEWLGLLENAHQDDLKERRTDRYNVRAVEQLFLNDVNVIPSLPGM